MTQEERVSEVFNRIRDYQVNEWGFDVRGAADNIKDFMEIECREYDNELFEWKWISATRRLAKLREYFHTLKNQNVFPDYFK